MSSPDWGGITPDLSHLRDADDDSASQTDEIHAGQWQEEMEYSVYADGSMTLPGQGESGPNCQIWKPAEFCDGCGEVSMAQNHCGRRSCPHCVGLWTQDRAIGITKRLSAARHVEEPGIDRRAVHAVMSSPEGSISSLNDVYDGFRTAYRLAEEKGIRGGVTVFHGYRVKDWVQDEYRSEDRPMGIWHWLMDERPESWRQLTYWSPHYHVVGLCRDFDADDPDEQEGWVAHRIDRQGGRSAFKPYTGLRDKDSYDEVVGTVRYLMSHATFESGTSKDCVRWFGELATTKFIPDEELSEGSYDVIDRCVREVVEAGPDDGDGAGVEEDDDECENCGSTSKSPIWDAGGALCDPGWCDEIGRDQEDRLTAAFKWAIGERLPPPGLKNPTTEEQADEALAELV
ncbi:hypothetical protein EGO51_19280 [Haloarcula hispanica]|uniref:Uncharacterized protein n=1 Tax=Haloarcula hispanica TaxID=51589 RepID=A0A5J5LES3_HALHI|nr:hypothetical protein EGO51_19280 [Haloarcula hispanica]